MNSPEEINGDTGLSDENTIKTYAATSSIAPSFYYGADLSYVNEMLDCGAVYKDAQGVVKDPYTIFAEAGTNLVRVRLWHNPEWTNYSNLADVEQSIRKAKTNGMLVLLDFHYSDTWTDPEKQKIPAAWESEMNNTTVLGNLMYDYTYSTLDYLSSTGLLPDIVQVGNETNPMILQGDELQWPIDWARNSHLFNRGIQAVRDISGAKNKPIEIMLHIAQPENALWWFSDATQNGITDFDWIGISYYPIWSDYDLNNLSDPLSSLINTYNKKLMIVETAYPFTMDNADTAANVLGQDALIDGYPASPQGQLDYLLDLKDIVASAGGEGLVYWEPAWVSTNCSTLWGQGSHWDNATLFDNNLQAMVGMQFFSGSLDTACNTIWALGDALTNTGWSWTSPADLTCNSNVQTATASLKVGSFRFFTIEEDWNSGLNYTYYDQSGYNIDPLLQNDNSSDANFYFTGTPGNYEIQIDNIQKLIEVCRIDPYYIIGDAIGGWNWNSAVVATSTEMGVWTISMALQTGKFRFFEIENDWDTDLRYQDLIALGYSIDNRLTSAGDVDGNFSFKGTPGNYTLTINKLEKTIILE